MSMLKQHGARHAVACAPFDVESDDSVSFSLCSLIFSPELFQPLLSMEHHLSVQFLFRLLTILPNLRHACVKRHFYSV